MKLYFLNVVRCVWPATLLLLAGCGQTTPPGRQSAMTSDSSYDEPHRPQFHFTPAANWMNDPNGMFYKDGEYHLSYQYYPDSTVWGPMHWGHAVSEDLVRWQHLPVALYPDSLGYIFSGSAVVDQANTSGFGKDGEPPVVAAFTHHDPVGEQAGTDDFQVQSLAYSLDNGRNWTKYKGNPVVPNDTGIRDFRDPKLIWHEESGRWIMVLAVYDRVMLYGSANLKDWEYLSEFGIEGDTRLWECPDLFPMRTAGNREPKWVLIVSIQKDGPTGGTGTSYFVGDFDGTTFTANPEEQKWLDHGADNYAFVTWDNAPVGWGRRLGIGWMSNWQYAQQVPTSSWRSAMTVPRVLHLEEEEGSYFLHALPVPSLSGLRRSELELDTLYTGRQRIEGEFSPSQCEVDLSVNLAASTATVFGITLSNEVGNRLVLTLDRGSNELTVDRTQSGPKGFSEVFFEGPHTAPLDLQKESLDLRILLDVASVEVFADMGKLNVTEIFFPEQPFSRLEVWTEDGQLQLDEGHVYGLSSIWEPLP